MPAVTERTPLIVNTESMDSTPIDERANQLLRLGARGISEPLAEHMDITHELASVLYALHIVERHDRARGSARAAAYRASETLRTRVALRQRAIHALDAALAYCDTEGHWQRDEDDDDVLVLSRPLPLADRCTTLAALLAHHTTPGEVLDHPLIRAGLPRAWSRSRRSRHDSKFELRGFLDHAVTPARAHVLELVANIVFMALTFVTALVPDNIVGPDTSGPTTIVWIVWAWCSLMGSLVDATHRRRGPSSSAHLVLLLPAQLAGVLYKVPHCEGIAVFLRLLAIPSCTLAIVLPSAPSLPFLLPHRLLPLATLLAGILARGAKAAALLVPLAAGLWAVYAYALNGDVWRAGDFAATAYGGGPVEVGVAPFETRVALLITLILVIGLSAGLSILRAMAPSNELHDGTWEAEYGPAIGHASRRALAAGVARYLPPSPDHAPPSPPLMLPLNVVVLPFDVIAGMWRMFHREPPFAIRQARGWIALFIVAAPCLLLAPLGAFLPHW